MPRRRKHAEFEIGKFWLSTIPRRRGYYAFWTDSGNGGTRRQSLGTEDFEEAKIKIAEIVLRSAPATVNSLLSVVLEKYFIEHSDGLPSAKPARHAGHLLLSEWGENVRVNDLTEEKQKEFVIASVDRGNSLG